MYLKVPNSLDPSDGTIVTHTKNSTSKYGLILMVARAINSANVKAATVKDSSQGFEWVIIDDPNENAFRLVRQS